MFPAHYRTNSTLRKTDLAIYLTTDPLFKTSIESQVKQCQQTTLLAGEMRFSQLIEQFAQETETDSGNSEETDRPSGDDDEESDPGSSDDEGLRIVPIPAEFWMQLPTTCLPRMLEFDSVREEFDRTFRSKAEERIESLRSDAPRLTLPMITELVSFNNRDLQTQKEALYRAALILSAQRYQYLLRPTRRNNGTGITYTHIRADSTSRSGLSIPSGAAVTRTTATAGQFLSSFANDVVLTFNGPQGFSANIATELLFEFQQTIFQRDVVFESLTQAERNVIYAARDFIRFQRGLFVDFAARYYQLLLAYRQIEIGSQDYFSNLRAFLQGRAEYFQAGRIPRIQVDQFEQNALRSSSSLVRNCNSLETLLDQLKIEIGLPPEMPLNIDLEELETLTASDALTVTRELVARTRRSLLDASGSGISDRNAAVNGAIVLINRLEETLQARREIEGVEEQTEAEEEARRLSRKLSLLEARLQADALQEDRKSILNSDSLLPARVFARTVDLIDARLDEARRGVELEQNTESSEEVSEKLDQIDLLVERLDGLVERWGLVATNQDFDARDDLVDRVNNLLEITDELARKFVDPILPRDDDELGTLIGQTIDATIALVDRIESTDVGGLDEVDIETNEAMLLALYQRLDLANQRGDLADARRAIKLLADDLRSILDLNVRHRLFTDRDIVNDLEMSADGSVTQVGIALDTPLNRRLERNAYRLALINYNQARRALIEQEDGIKFAIREDLRQLRLRRNQYQISVARAALAYERVVSTRLQLQLAVGNVVARDFLEAQQAFTAALSSVASDHISFILERISLFNDTESIRLNETGYWLETQEDSLRLPMSPDFYDANPNPYGRIPEWLDYSDEIRCNH